MEQLSISLPGEYMPYIFIINGVLMAAIGLRFLMKVRRLSRYGVRTGGLLVRIERNHMPVIHIGETDTPHESHRRNRTMGVYRYVDASGSSHELKSDVPYHPVVGESSVTVLYNPLQPGDAMVIDAVRPLQLPSIATIVGIVATIVGLCMLAV